ncbi:phosphopantothenoylcysteine decarboxylase [Candidatus Endobugula sertula]|uniref:Coenzyme A biosynthesis bifunctional protein CoaBC n=1 Tax=Candidatus Endobugula sertula TaxID=62101 RepID=A0A1D2QRC6_9GAMM|nr:phosphopantothenoylcysteine decarboxylase [Candidatus Endobugula sertula]
MSNLMNRRILLGVSGGIAAYKSAELIRRLQDMGADVRVVMTRAAEAFMTPLTLQALSGHPVHNDLLDPEAEAAMGHISLARWADLILIAPASADIIARLAHGKGDNLLTTVCLARRCELAIAPAMNEAMWHNQATQDNLAILQQRGIHQLGPASGGQACGDIGMGRMSEPSTLASEVSHFFETGLLAGKTVVITAGPTREAIDPVRYISNHSSGKMGYALAQATVDAGAKVILISGPTALPCPDRVTCIHTSSAIDMYQSSMDHLPGCDIFIASAAVADFRPATIAEQKIKKTGQDTMHIEMVKNPDIVTAIANADPKPFVVGFAAETHDVIHYARDKLQRKNLDMVVANDISDTHIGFNSDDNIVTILTAESEQYLPKANKFQQAQRIIQAIAKQY